ncbi:MAG TPA: L,D-transpeptidase [Bryobacteraceae bacterium]|nr:L,D-transpeptidase [Bryobacteraceae bacterium]
MQALKIMAILVAAAADVYGDGATRKLVISIPDRKIALIEDGRVVKIFPVAVGKANTPSPHGTFHIASRVVNPTWYQPGKVVGPGAANPLGTRWMGLGYKGYGIHGTNRPSSIGHAASHGCIRMRIADVEALFALVQVGDEVDLLNEVPPDLASVFGHVSTAQVAALTSVAAGGAQ